MGNARYSNIYRVIGEVAPKVIVETGTYGGSTALSMIYQAYYANKCTDKIEYYGFDLFAESVTEELKNREFIGTMVPPTIDEVRNRLKDVPANVYLTKGDTRQTLKDTELPKIDFVFIDGGHSAETIASDWTNLQRFMHKGTVTIFDDYWTGLREDNGCRPVVDSLDRTKYKVEVLEPSDDWHKYGNIYKINMVEVRHII
jgi:predicted O-methyltransferase YrrM